MKINKNLIISLISIIIISAVIYIWFNCKTKTNVILEPKEFQKELIYTKTQIKNNTPVYDYKNLLSLMDNFRIIEQRLFENFSNFINKPNNLKNLKKILYAFQQERNHFKIYIRTVKEYHFQSISSRKLDSLRYYFRVLENSIDKTKKMIKRFNLHIKIQIKNNIQN